MTVRAYYAALGIELPDRATPNVPVRCFAQPDAHNRGDRSPSCSVNLASGAWNCHGCGAHGGAYDAALAAGHSPRSAMQLLVAHGLAEPYDSDHGTSRRPPNPTHHPFKSTPTPKSADSTALAAAEHDVQAWAEMLDDNGRLIRQLALRRGWGWRAIRDLKIGFDGARITIPIRGRDGALRGVLRYDPFGRRDPKMLAVPGTRLGLIPHPARESSDRVVLVEGPPDMVAARSSGLPAIAIPGTSAWQPSWAKLLAGRHITIVMDSDTPGRRAAGEIATALGAASIPTEIVDLWPDRNDGYDLTDRILERRRLRPALSVARTIGSLLTSSSASPSQQNARPRCRAQEASR